MRLGHPRIGSGLAVLALTLSALASIAPVGPFAAPAGAMGGPADPGACDVTVSSVAALQAEQTVAPGTYRVICIAPGTYTIGAGGAGELRWTRAKTILVGQRSPAIQPRPSAVPRLIGQLTVAAPEVTVRGISIERPLVATNSGAFRIFEDGVSLLDSYVSAVSGSCVEVGYLDKQASLPTDTPGKDAGTGKYHKVSNILVRGNVIDRCASNADPLPAQENTYLRGWTCGGSGLPGIYSQWTENAEFSDNIIVNTPLRGIQLYPYNHDVRVTQNLLRRNSVAVNVGTTDGTDGWPRASSIAITGNVFAEQSSLDLAARYKNLRRPDNLLYAADGTRPEVRATGEAGTCGSDFYLNYNSPPYTTIDDQVQSYDVQTTNDGSGTFSGNCGADASYNDEWDGKPSTFTWGTNDPRTAVFAGPDDHRQTSNSPCKGVGPVRLRPTSGSLSIAPNATASATIGDMVTHTFTVSNDTSASRSITLTLTPPAAGANQSVAYYRTTGTGCASATATSCVTTLGVGATWQVSITYAAARGAIGGFPTLETAAVAASPGVAAASSRAATPMGGSFCTYGTAQSLGTPGNDTLYASTSQSGSNLCGFEGDDTLVPSVGGDALYGGTGNDTVDYSPAQASAVGSTAGWNIDLGTGSATRAAQANDVLKQIEHATGSPYADTIIGTTAGNVLRGGAGNDSISAGSGNDTIDAGEGDDEVNPGAGDDAKISGGLGIDTLSFNGTTGAVTANLAAGTAAGGAGTDSFTSFDHLRGGSGNDSITGSSSANRIWGGAGSDSINGGLGNDTIAGEAGEDTVSYAGSPTGVTVSLKSGTASGGAGTDALATVENVKGSSYADSITGSTASNKIWGGTGNDAVNGLEGADQLLGEAGTDTLSYYSILSGVVISLNSNTASGGGGADSISGFENLKGGSGNDQLFGSNSANTIWGGLGDDQIWGNAGVDVLYGEAGNDVLNGGLDSDTCYQASTGVSC